MIDLRIGECVSVLGTVASSSVDACITDPPYHLTTNKRGGSGFMGKGWDGGDVAFRPETWEAVFRVLKPGAHLMAFGGTRTYHRMVCAVEDAGFEIRDQTAWVYGSGFPKSRNLDGDWRGWGTAMKPAWEPIVVARKPLIGTVAENVLAHGTGALNIDGCRAEDTPTGRWPANLVHDGSDEVLACFPDSKGSGPARALKRGTRDDGWGMQDAPGFLRDAGSGSAARFFYCAKASTSERNRGVPPKPNGKPGNDHLTVKPIALMRWLVRLVTPPGGTVLDPFAGSGTTGLATQAEGFDALLIEMDEKHAGIIRQRCGLAEDPFG